MAKRTSGFAERTREWAEILIPVLREVARRHGYALAVHGSLSYDIDLLAAPWTDLVVGNPTSAEDLAAGIRKAIEGICGWVHPSNSIAPSVKPHGRLAWSFHLGGGPYVDLSVMPRILPQPSTPPPSDEPPVMFNEMGGKIVYTPNPAEPTPIIPAPHAMLAQTSNAGASPDSPAPPSPETPSKTPGAF